MSKSYIYGLIFGLALLIVAGVAGSRQAHKDTKFLEAEEKAYQEELRDATPVKLGVLGKNQRIHSSLFSYYRQVRGGKSISGLVAQAKGKTRIVETIIFPQWLKQ